MARRLIHVSPGGARRETVDAVMVSVCLLGGRSGRSDRLVKEPLWAPPSPVSQQLTDKAREISQG